MGFCYIGNGAGGTELNFRIVNGTSAPASPRENTIWVNTDQDITDFVFGYAEPEKVDGRLWIQTGLTSAVAFNALKKNQIQVATTAAKICSDGSWASVVAKTYQGGAWKDWWDGQLFENGNQYTDYTGGWIATSSNKMKASVGDVMTFNHVYYDGEGGDDPAFIRSVKPVNITEYRTLVAEVTGRNGTITLGVLTGSNSSLFEVSATLSDAEFNEELRVDLPPLSGNHYIAVSGYLTDSQISRVWLER